MWLDKGSCSRCTTTTKTECWRQSLQERCLWTFIAPWTSSSTLLQLTSPPTSASSTVITKERSPLRTWKGSQSSITATRNDLHQYHHILHHAHHNSYDMFASFGRKGKDQRELWWSKSSALETYIDLSAYSLFYSHSFASFSDKIFKFLLLRSSERVRLRSCSSVRMTSASWICSLITCIFSLNSFRLYIITSSSSSSSTLRFSSFSLAISSQIFLTVWKKPFWYGFASVCSKSLMISRWLFLKLRACSSLRVKLSSSSSVKHEKLLNIWMKG